MTTYNISRQPGPLGANTGGPGGSELPPTQDSTFTNPGGMQAGSSFYGVDANITSVSNVSYTGTGTKDGHVTVNFTYTGASTTDGIAEIYYGLYVAEPGQVPNQGSGTTTGASGWSGGSLQTTVDIGGSGATSIQLAPSGIIRGEISGMKFNDLDGNGIKGSGEPGLEGWTIQLCADAACNIVLDTTTTDANGNYCVLGDTGCRQERCRKTTGTTSVKSTRAGGRRPHPQGNVYGPLVVSAATPQRTRTGTSETIVMSATSRSTSTSPVVRAPRRTTPTTRSTTCVARRPAMSSLKAGCVHRRSVHSSVGTDLHCDGAHEADCRLRITRLERPRSPTHLERRTTASSPSRRAQQSTAVEVTVNNSTELNGRRQRPEAREGPHGGTDRLRPGRSGSTTTAPAQAFDGHVDVTAGSFETVSGFPTGTVCTITETLPDPRRRATRSGRRPSRRPRAPRMTGLSRSSALPRSRSRPTTHSPVTPAR